jgi:hypothetical protein
VRRGKSSTFLPKRTKRAHQRGDQCLSSPSLALCVCASQVGVCKRKGLAIVALHPLGDGADEAHAAAVAVAASCGQT